jgi:hypothetical protein
VRAGEAVVGEGGGGGAVGGREQERAGGEEERVQLQEAAREREVLPEEALEDGVRVRRGAPHGHGARAIPETSPPAAGRW